MDMETGRHDNMVNAYYMQLCPMGAQGNSLAFDPSRVRSKLPIYNESMDGVRES